MDDKNELVAFGEPVKALGGGKIGGYLVRFSGDEDPDLTGDYFTAKTDFGEADRLPVLYHHGMDGTLGRKRIGKAELKRDEAGIWAEAQLALRDEYERKVYELAEAGKLGWSSGTASHVIDAAPTGKSRHITQWFLTEASLTPTPAEPRNAVVPLKSLLPTEPKEAADTAGKADAETIQEEETMTEINMEEMVNAAAAKAAELAAQEAVKTYIEAQKPATSAGVVVTEDEADRALTGNPFKSAGEFFKAVKVAELAPHSIDKRLLPLKATGLNEAIPSQGGFLVPPEYASGIRDTMFSAGALLSRMNIIPVSGNSMTFNAVDEQSRVDASRRGGILGYWLAEGGTKTATKPKFRQIDIKLNKVAALCYATDELLEDAAALEGWLANAVADELRFKIEDAIVNGDGVGKPLGILSSPAVVQPLRTDANEIDAADIGRMWSRRHPGYNDYIWLTSPSTFPQLMQMVIGQMPVWSPPLTERPYGALLGRPLLEVEYCAALGTAGDLILFSPSAYLAIEKSGGIQAASSIHVNFLVGESVYRFIARMGGQPEYASATTPFKGSNTVSPYVVLSASTA